jgi:hypothetical protein
VFCSATGSDVLPKLLVTLGLIAAVLAAVPVSAQIDVVVSRGVDTTNGSKKEVLDLWTDYLNSRPDVMWSDQNWDAAKNRLWRDFDLTAPFVYQPGADQFLQTYRPTVMAIEREGDLYSIRTLFYAEGLDSANAGRNVWAIVRVYAGREGGDWKLRNALGVQTKAWNRPAIGKITFVSPPEHDFNTRLALRSVAFCDSISGLFPFFSWDSFDFYITSSREEADRIIGLEFFHAGPARGRAMRADDILITGAGSEWYPEGLVRMVAKGNGIAPHELVENGFAGWAGGWDGRPFDRWMPEIAAFVAYNDSLVFDDYAAGNRIPDLSGLGLRYFPGAVVCDMVYAAAGASGIETLFKAGRRDADLYRAIESTTGLGQAAFRDAWRARVLEFLQ